MLRTILSFLALIFVLSACSGPNSNTGSNAGSILRSNLGSSARSHIVTTAQDALLTRYGYRFNREVNTVEDVRFETSWKDLTLLGDEQAAGYIEVRVRITITARPRNRAAGTGATFSSRFEAEFEAIVTSGGNYQPVPITPEREEYILEIADYLENEFKAGVM